jgi:hypothetical protein
MIAVLEQLLVLQDRDRRIGQLKAEAARIPQQIAEAEARLRAESERLESLRQQLRHLETERKKLEIDAESKRAQVAKYRTQLFQIKSNTEYQALLKEIQKAEEEVTALEDAELELMQQSENLHPALRDEQTVLKEITAKTETEKAEAQRRAAAIEQELQQLQTERAALVAGVEPDVRARYERLMRSKGDAVVVPIRNGNCGGCHLHLAPQVVHNVRHSAELTGCDYCGRILYWLPE